MFVCAAIAPHGGEVIRELAGEQPKRMAVTRAGLEELGRRFAAKKPETIIVFTPHGFVIDNCICLTIAGCTEGRLQGEDGTAVTMKCRVNQALTRDISDRAKNAGIAIAHAAYTDRGAPAESVDMDWGVLVPLWFTGARLPQAPQIVVACPSRKMERADLVEFGRICGAAAEEADARVAIIASADQGHGHLADGPYGYTEHSALHDAEWCTVVREHRLGDLLGWTPEFVEGGLVDSYWQTLMLHGALQVVDMRPELISYEAPTYFGMACVAYSR